MNILPHLGACGWRTSGFCQTGKSSAYIFKYPQQFLLPPGHSPVFVVLGGYLLMYLHISFNLMSRYANFPIVMLAV